MFADAQAYDRFAGCWGKLAAALLVDFTGLPDAGAYVAKLPAIVGRVSPTK